MYISEIFKSKKPVLSFEVFPPKKTSPISTIYKTLDSLVELKPDYISVTYVASGSACDNTLEIASKIKNDLKIETLAHLTCVNSSKDEIKNVLQSFKNANIENILA